MTSAHRPKNPHSWRFFFYSLWQWLSFPLRESEKLTKRLCGKPHAQIMFYSGNYQVLRMTVFSGLMMMQRENAAGLRRVRKGRKMDERKEKFSICLKTATERKRERWRTLSRGDRRRICTVKTSWAHRILGFVCPPPGTARHLSPWPSAFFLESPRNLSSIHDKPWQRNGAVFSITPATRLSRFGQLGRN